MIPDIYDVPVLKTFLFNGRYYMYEPFSNGLFEITKELYNELGCLQEIGFSKYIKLSKSTNEYKDIVMLIHKGIIRKSCIEKIEHPETNYVGFLIDRCINDITLQVTRDCNFNCRYCMFANNNYIGRIHERINMPLDIAKKSIDFLYEHSQDATTVTVGFYGGEPLINFDLIKEVVKYAEKRFFSKKIIYRMTINGSILTDEIISFLVEHEFIIVISLDGPELIQNKHRKFGASGNGTFDTVISNVNNLRNNYGNYFKENVSFISVVFDDEDSREVLNFFKSINIPEYSVKLMSADLSGIDYSKSNSYIEDKSNPLFKSFYERSLKMYNKKGTISKTWHHSGQCIPSIKSLFINVYGEFYPCEKIVESDSLSIGNITKGLNITKITKFLNIGKLNEAECKLCWAMRFCDTCIAQCLDIEDGNITFEAKHNSCEKQRQKALYFLKNYLMKKYESKD